MLLNSASQQHVKHVTLGPVAPPLKLYAPSLRAASSMPSPICLSIIPLCVDKALEHV